LLCQRYRVSRALVFVHQFFPAFSPTAGTLATFAVGFTARSFGGAASRI